MRQAVVILAVLVSGAALAISVTGIRKGGLDKSGTSGMDGRVEIMRSRLRDLDRKLAEADRAVRGVVDRVNGLDELSKGLIELSRKAPSEAKLREAVDQVLEEKLKKVKWTTKTKVNFEPKSEKDKKFASVHAAVRGAARLDGEQSNSLLALMLEQRGKLNDVYRRKQDKNTRDRQLSDVKRQFDGVLKWKFTSDQYRRYIQWRGRIKDSYMKAFLIP